MTLLQELLGGVDESPAAVLKVAAGALQKEIGKPRTDGYQFEPRGTDCLIVVDLPRSVDAGSSGLAWLVLRLVSHQRWAIELWIRRAPHFHTDTHCQNVLAKGELTGTPHITEALTAFAREFHARGGVPK